MRARTELGSGFGAGRRRRASRGCPRLLVVEEEQALERAESADGGWYAAESIIPQVDVDEGVRERLRSTQRASDGRDAVPARRHRSKLRKRRHAVVRRAQRRQAIEVQVEHLERRASRSESRRRDDETISRARERLEPSESRDVRERFQSVSSDVQSSQARGVREGGREGRERVIARPQLAQSGRWGEESRGERSESVSRDVEDARLDARGEFDGQRRQPAPRDAQLAKRG